MAAPIEISLVSIKLRIKINESISPDFNHTDSSTPWEYTFTNDEQINSANQEGVKGLLSPISPVTLPPMTKEEAGIPLNARSYAFVYPPQGLAQDSFSDPEIKSLAVLGGFAYFDESYECILINALSLGRSDPKSRKLRFSGPFRVNQIVCDELYKLCRRQPLQLDIFHEIGFVSYAWVRPNELFQFKSAFVTEGHTKINSNHNGAMLFFRENGTAEAYAVDSCEYVDPSGYVGILSDAVEKINQAKPTDCVIQSIKAAKAWRDEAKYLMKSMHTTELVGKPKNKETLHMACRAALGHNFIRDVLSCDAEKSNLTHRDSFGWNPLHYACCFSPADDELIKLLVTACSEAVAQFDNYNRSPLHIACNSDTSEKVIAILLEADASTPKVTIKKKTRMFGFLPLHLACYNGASDNIINALLDADNDGTTATEKSKYGKLPLHLAIMKKLPASMVKVFLDADSKPSKSDGSSSDTKAETETSMFDDDIYQTVDGKLPLHLACFNNSSSEIIQLLLDKDEQNTTSNETAVIRPNSLHTLTSRTTMTPMLVRTNRVRNMSLTEEVIEGSEGIVALHLAMRHGSASVISLLLRKEMERKNSHETDRVSVCRELEPETVHRIDSVGRTPLHIACQYNVGYQIIQSLLNLDPHRQTTQMEDAQGFMPIHYACENKGTSVETINILLDAEDIYIKNQRERDLPVSRSTLTGAADRRGTPLYLAVKTGADTKVIERLLTPEDFDLYGFDDPAIADLANIVKRNEVLREKVINILSERPYLFLFLLEFYFCVGAIVFFTIGSENFVAGRRSITEPVILVICATMFILRELLQWKSVGVSYIGDVWSWVEIVGIILLLCSSAVMFQDVASPGIEERSWLLIMTNFFIIFQMIIYLRSTFLPFARFVGGLLMILRKLIAFVVVSVLLVFAFAYAFWMIDVREGKEGSHPSILKCLKQLFGSLFEFEPPQIRSIEIIFGFLIVIVLLNVVIAIVGEAWTSAAEKSTQMFWVFRLEKVLQLRYAIKVYNTCNSCISSKFDRHPFINLMKKVDRVENISFKDNISWTKPPYNMVTKKDQYDNPDKYFKCVDSLKIVGAHSLQADLLWTEIEEAETEEAETKKANLKYCWGMILIFKWLGHCLMYAILVVLGIPLCGLVWPKKFRAGVLSIGIRDSLSDRAVMTKLMTVNSSIMQRLAETNTEVKELKSVNAGLSEVNAGLSEVNAGLSEVMRDNSDLRREMQQLTQQQLVRNSLRSAP